MTVLVVLEALVIAVLAVLVVGLLRSHAEILRELHRLGVSNDGHHAHGDTPVVRDGIARPRVGTIEAVDVAGVKPGGGAAKLTMTGPQATLLAFMSSGCSVCAGFWEAFTDRLELPDPDARLVIVTKGPDNESESAVKRLAPKHHQTLMSSEAWEDYKVPVSPYFVLVGSDGSVVGEGAAANWAQLANLMNEALEDRRSASHRARHERIDRDLSAAGIEPGDPSLWPDEEAEDG